MAASFGILSPYGRIMDIATRRTIDTVNRGYFLAELIRTLAYMADKMQLPYDLAKYADLYFTQGKEIDEMMRILKIVSDDSFACIQDAISERG